MQADKFFDGFRSAVADLPRGLIRAGSARPRLERAFLEQQAGGAVPESLLCFLQSWNGASLFNEAITILAAEPSTEFGGPPRAADLGVSSAFREGDIVFAQGANSDYVLNARMGDNPPVFRVDAGSDERWHSGTSLSAWLCAVIAHESVIFDDEGEYAEMAFEEDEDRITPVFALRQAEKALKKDRAADWLQELGTAQRSFENWFEAAQAFDEAAQLDPENPWSAFDLGRALEYLAAGSADEDKEAIWAQCAEAYLLAAKRCDGLTAARFCVFAARAWSAIDAHDKQKEAIGQANALAGDIESHLKRAAHAAAKDEDNDAFGEANSLLLAFEARAGRSLPVLS